MPPALDEETDEDEETAGADAADTADTDDEELESSSEGGDAQFEASKPDADEKPAHPAARAPGGAGAAPGAQKLANDTHDEEQIVTDAEAVATPKAAARPEAAERLVNDTHDESLAVDGETVLTPTQRAQLRAQHRVNDTHDEVYELADGEEVGSPAARGKGAAGAAQELRNTTHDAVADVDSDGPQVPTPRARAAPSPTAGGRLLKNANHDEEVSAHDSDHVDTPRGDAPGDASVTLKNAPIDVVVPVSPTSSVPTPAAPAAEPPPSTPSSPAAPEDPTLYNPAEFEDLEVSSEVRELFQFIGVYKPSDIQVEQLLHPFVPDFIPAIGYVDAFLKPPRPSGPGGAPLAGPDPLGLIVLDEPGEQSNRSVVLLQQGMQARKPLTLATQQHVESVEEAHKKPKVIEKWISDLKKLHQGKPSPAVNYSAPMPDLETLLQVWPADFEDLLGGSTALPPAAMDLDLAQYMRIVCILLDIPTYGNLVESAHLFLSLYSEFKANQHFQGGAFSSILSN
eukprot:TRINITY_DN8854_c5_g1_i1.p1 TRINITY_DN8854_c5_g1~~TRINITY_DN8854_c5_g1_i1.p1  ORF type:complete len:533 (+),score=170.11 TRINITY_DN8854_c5_g1_i1:66-1601(+)